MSGRFLALCALGLLGSLFVGYCVYFDRKRRSEPDYKKKVVARESGVGGRDRGDVWSSFDSLAACRKKNGEKATEGD